MATKLRDLDQLSREIVDLVFRLDSLHHPSESIPDGEGYDIVNLRGQRLTENEFIDFSRLWHDGCVKAIIEAQDVDRNHPAKV